MHQLNRPQFQLQTEMEASSMLTGFGDGIDSLVAGVGLDVGHGSLAAPWLPCPPAPTTSQHISGGQSVHDVLLGCFEA